MGICARTRLVRLARRATHDRLLATLCLRREGLASPSFVVPHGLPHFQHGSLFFVSPTEAECSRPLAGIESARRQGFWIDAGDVAKPSIDAGEDMRRSIDGRTGNCRIDLPYATQTPSLDLIKPGFHVGAGDVADAAPEETLETYPTEIIDLRPFLASAMDRALVAELEPDRPAKLAGHSSDG